MCNLHICNLHILIYILLNKFINKLVYKFVNILLNKFINKPLNNVLNKFSDLGLYLGVLKRVENEFLLVLIIRVTIAGEASYP